MNPITIFAIGALSGALVATVALYGFLSNRFHRKLDEMYALPKEWEDEYAEYNYKKSADAMRSFCINHMHYRAFKNNVLNLSDNDWNVLLRFFRQMHYSGMKVRIYKGDRQDHESDPEQSDEQLRKATFLIYPNRWGM